MTTFLTVALVVMTLVCLLLGSVCWRLVTSIEHTRAFEEQRRDEWTAEREHLRRYVGSITRVLNQRVGGVGKRMSESLEIAEAISRRSPELFKECPGLAYWLHANHQFLSTLCDVGAEGLMPEERRRVHEIRQYDADVFRHIYKCAGLPGVADAVVG